MNDTFGVTVAYGLEQALGYLCALLLLEHPILRIRFLLYVIAVNQPMHFSLVNTR